ncbi:uncharacterized [Lates japonicus]
MSSQEHFKKDLENTPHFLMSKHPPTGGVISRSLPVPPLSLGPELQEVVQRSHESDFCILNYEAEKPLVDKTAACEI